MNFVAIGPHTGSQKGQDMTVKFTQALIDKAVTQHDRGKILYDSELAGLRLVIGKKTATYKLVTSINDGSNRHVSLTVGRSNLLTLRAARDHACELKLKLQRGEDPRRPKDVFPTVREALDGYLKAPNLSKRTVEFYGGAGERLGSLLRSPVDKVTPQLCADLHTRLTNRCGPSAANGSLRTLKAVLNHQARTLDLPPNPVTRGVRMNPERPRDWSIAPEDMPAMWQRLEAIEDPIMQALWTTLLFTGLRSADGRSIKWEHIDVDGVLTVPNPKGGERRAFKLPIADFALERIRALPRFNEYVFYSPAAEKGYTQQLRRRTGFPYSPHQMRHTFRTMAFEAGVDFQTIVVLMNHSSPHVSFNYVTRANLLGPMRDAVAEIEAKILRYRKEV